MPGRQFSTHASNPEAIDALHDGVPEWMRSSLDAWLLSQLTDSTYTSGNVPKTDLIRSLERLLRANLTNNASQREILQVIFSKMHGDTNLKLDVVDGIIQLNGTPYSGTETLERILIQSGSKWKVVRDDDGNYSLQERVDSTATAAMDDLGEQEGDASSYMVKAWNDAFGRSPNPSSAYSNVIKAVEAASWQAVTPGNSRATLGTIIRELTDHPDNFQVSIHEKHQNQGIETIRQDMSFLWDGQTDRHGTSNPVAPSQDAAEQAIFLGLSLCQQFTRGLVSHTE